MSGRDPGVRAAAARGLATSLGFDLVGIAPAEPTPDMAFLPEWIARGYGGEMRWIARRAEERMDPRRVLAEARSVVCVALAYGGGGSGPRSVARYAGGDDYHLVLLERLHALSAGLEAWVGEPVSSRAYVDTGPVLERSLAARAGLGWIGKNTLLLHRRLGSMLLLGVLLTDLALEADEPEPDRCGSCTACLDACPTAAFPAPYVLDASRCLSYTTIELRTSIPEPLRAAQGERVFGCDVCQEVCPWNRRDAAGALADPLGLRARLAPRPEWAAPSLEWLLGLDESAWQRATRATALRRARHRCLIRNALVAAGNRADPSLRPALLRHAEGADPMLAEHARWALDRLAGGAAPSA